MLKRPEKPKAVEGTIVQEEVDIGYTLLGTSILLIDTVLNQAQMISLYPLPQKHDRAS